jgi:hypothetical protein
VKVPLTIATVPGFPTTVQPVMDVLGGVNSVKLPTGTIGVSKSPFVRRGAE